ncbi:MAG: DUF1669 domain-containing protein [Planctomycetes bacterium]|nr:DUF1669 domain-containing protein [Planctomycetota bacterium]
MNKAILALAVLVLIPAAVPPAGEPEAIFAPTEGDRLIEKRISREIRGARKSVVVAIYQFTSKEIADALAAAKRRGVDVRVLVDTVQAGNGGLFADVLKLLSSAGVPIRKVYPEGVRFRRTNPKKNEGMRPKFHHKFCVVDGERVITGSYNWTVLADEENHENIVILPDPRIAARFSEQFDKVWKDEAITEPYQE